MIFADAAYTYKTVAKEIRINSVSGSKMKKILSLLFIFSFLVVSNIQAQSAKTVPSSALLYKITGKGLKKPSYLFGTIHLICEKNMFSPEKLKNITDQAEQILLETDFLDPAALKRAQSAAIMADGKTMKDYLTQEEYAKVDELFKTYMGYSFDNLKAFKPMFATAAVLTSPKILGCQPPVIYDNYFAQMTRVRKISLIGLESMDVQMAVVDSIPLDQQIKELKETAADPEKTIAEFKRLSQTYLSQDSDKIYDLVVAEMKKPGYSQAIMVDNRNKSWISVIQKNIAAKPSFIAVGAGHLGGKNGVVNLLRRKGYKLTPIRF